VGIRPPCRGVVGFCGARRSPGLALPIRPYRDFPDPDDHFTGNQRHRSDIAASGNSTLDAEYLLLLRASVRGSKRTSSPDADKSAADL